jgi:hypothetical protein
VVVVAHQALALLLLLPPPQLRQVCSHSACRRLLCNQAVQQGRIAALKLQYQLQMLQLMLLAVIWHSHRSRLQLSSWSSRTTQHLTSSSSRTWMLR